MRRRHAGPDRDLARARRGGRRRCGLRTVSANVFTDPELATVGVSQNEMDAGKVPGRSVMLPLASNARAKMVGLRGRFREALLPPGHRLVIGGVVVAPKASELILPITMAIENHLTVDQLAHTITIYPSLSGSIAEAAASSCTSRATWAEPPAARAPAAPGLLFAPRVAIRAADVGRVRASGARV